MSDDDVDIEFKNDTPFLSLAYAGDLERVKIQIEKNPKVLKEVNAHGMNALLVASSYGNISLMKYFIDEIGLSIDSKDDNGCNIMLVACCTGELNSIKFMFKEYEQAAKKLIMEKDYAGQDALSLCKKYEQNTVLKYLVDYFSSLTVDKNEIL